MACPRGAPPPNVILISADTLRADRLGAYGYEARPTSPRIDALAGTALPRVVFGYAPGPRTKTAAENAMWARLGADVASMTLAPEIVLANELEIPCAALVVDTARPSRAAPHRAQTV